MRVPQERGVKGSLRWIQGVGENTDHPVTLALRAQLKIDRDVSIDWRSPRQADDFAEYRDVSFLDLLGLSHLADQLRDFWPPRGPQWDALAVASDKRVFLVEAKAHIGEMHSDCAAGRASRERISLSLDKAKQAFGAPSPHDWLSGYYQYANRLAHVQFLRQHDVDAHLVGVYFLGDTDVRGPQEIAAWARAIDDCHDVLGLLDTHNLAFLHHLFVRVG